MTPSVFDPELSSTAVAETGLSELDSDTGTFRIRGFSIADVAEKASYEEAAWLLFEGRLPTDEELTEFETELAAARGLSADVHDLIRAGAEAGASAMDVLRMALAAACLDTDDEDVLVATQRVVAVCPTIVAAYWRYRRGVDPVEPSRTLSHAANFLYMLTGKEPDDATVEGLETYLTTIVEHGLNPSTFAARIVGSTGSDPFSAASAAVGALKGPRHGGAIERVHEVLRSVENRDDLAAYVESRFDDDGTLAGFGHSVYDARDRRAAILDRTAERVFDTQRAMSLLSDARRLEDAVEEYVAATYPERRLHVTVDYYAAVLLRGLDVPPALFAATFAVGRAAGWMAHYLEQLESDTLLRPRSRYVGPDERPWIPRPERYVPGGSTPPSPGALEGISSVLGVLSDSARLELLLILYEAASPLSYSTIRTRSTIDDKGRFNYHLRKLRGLFVERTEAGYALTDVGRDVVETLLDDDRLLARAVDAER